MMKVKEFFANLWQAIKRLCRKFTGWIKKHWLKYKETRNNDLLLPRKSRGFFPLAVVFTTLKCILLVGIFLVCAVAGLAIGVAKAYIDTTPDIDVSMFTMTDSDRTSYIYDSNGDVITSFAGMEYRDWAELDEIPDMLINAVLSVEDVRFYKHNGLDYKRLVSAVISTLTNSNTHGASTITQQLIKNTVLTNVQSYKRKIQEAYLALELEDMLTKDIIIESYLNNVYLGESNYGVKAAAKDYFGKELSDLTIRECAMIAGIIQQPSYTNPRANTYKRFYDDGTNKMDRTNSRTDTVIWAMYEAGSITADQRDQALNDDVNIVIVEQSETSSMYDMPYFVEYAIYDVITCWLEQEGMADTKSNRSAIETMLRTGGYSIYTTVDPEIQTILEDTVSTWEEYPELADPTANVVVSTNSDGTTVTTQQPQAAAVIIDHHTGQIVALVGGRNTPTIKKAWNRAYQSNMPVGSAIKPLAVYGPALDNGFSPASIVANFEGEIEGYGGNGYPAIGSERWIGPITLRRGITSSLNVAAARVLFEFIDTQTSKDYLINLGIDESRINQDGPGLALGTSGITPIEMAAAFGAVANSGEYIRPISFTKVVDSSGKVVLSAENIQERRQVFRPSTAYMLVDMMEDVVKSGTGTAAQIEGMTVAGKTGTNENYTSVYFAGVTPYYSASLWIGHDNYSQKLRTGSTGGTYAAPLWQAFMSQIHNGLLNKPIIDESPVELGLVRRTVCSISGKLATAACHADEYYKPVTDWFYNDDAPSENCDMHTLLSICVHSGEPASAYCTETSTGAFVLMNSSSVFRRFDLETLLQSIPNSIFTDIPVSQYGGANCESYAYCSVHTPWYIRAGTDEQTLSVAINEARNLLRTVRGYLDVVNDLPRIETETLRYGMNWLEYAIEVEDINLIGMYTEQLRYNYELICAEYPPPVGS